MQRSVLNKLLLARRLFELARDNLISTNDLSLSIGANLLQDSVETFLLAVSEQVNAGIVSRTDFDKYFELINEKIFPKALPFRSRLIALNKLRVNSKHYGLVPAKSETDVTVVSVREFFEEVTESVFGMKFGTISLIDLLREGEARELVREAEEAFKAGDFGTCLIASRKAIYVRFEEAYDIAPFATDPPTGLGLLGAMFKKSPYFVRNKDYIDKNVMEPTDYIVFDHNALEMDLMKSGIDSVAFWNVWRLTPEVHRSVSERKWTIKDDFTKLDGEGIEKRAEYVLDATISILAAADQTIAAARSPERSGGYVANLARDQVPVYKKADDRSEIVATTPPGLTTLKVDFSIDGLDGKGRFWHVSHADDSQYIVGYIAEDCVV
jgi:hypothetical protein